MSKALKQTLDTPKRKSEDQPPTPQSLTKQPSISQSKKQSQLSPRLSPSYSYSSLSQSLKQPSPYSGKKTSFVFNADNQKYEYSFLK